MGRSRGGNQTSKINKPFIKIEEVSSHEQLVLYFSDDCSWHQYINYINKMAGSEFI